MRVLQYVAVCCNSVQSVAADRTHSHTTRGVVCCSVLQCVAVRCSALQGVAVNMCGDIVN